MDISILGDILLYMVSASLRVFSIVGKGIISSILLVYIIMCPEVYHGCEEYLRQFVGL